MMKFELQNGDYTLSTDRAKLDFEAIHAFLSQTYWGKHRSRDVLRRAIANSFCFGVYKGTDQIGFARVITDYATFGYLADVYILEPYRRRGLGRWLVNNIVSHPRLAGLRRWALVTQDCHNLYRDCGFTELQFPEHHMQRLRPYPGALETRPDPEEHPSV